MRQAQGWRVAGDPELPRQWGESTVTAVKALHEADGLSIVVSPTRRRSRERVLKAAGFATHVWIYLRTTRRAPGPKSVRTLERTGPPITTILPKRK
jgi:hypothetical protein